MVRKKKKDKKGESTYDFDKMKKYMWMYINHFMSFFEEDVDLFVKQMNTHLFSPSDSPRNIHTNVNHLQSYVDELIGKHKGSTTSANREIAQNNAKEFSKDQCSKIKEVVLNKKYHNVLAFELGNLIVDRIIMRKVKFEVLDMVEFKYAIKKLYNHLEYRPKGTIHIENPVSPEEVKKMMEENKQKSDLLSSSLGKVIDQKMNRLSDEIIEDINNVVTTPVITKPFHGEREPMKQFLRTLWQFLLTMLTDSHKSTDTNGDKWYTDSYKNPKRFFNVNREPVENLKTNGTEVLASGNSFLKSIWLVICSGAVLSSRTSRLLGTTTVNTGSSIVNGFWALFKMIKKAEDAVSSSEGRSSSSQAGGGAGA